MWISWPHHSNAALIPPLECPPTEVASESTAWIATHMSELHSGACRFDDTNCMSQPLRPVATRSPSIHREKVWSGFGMQIPWCIL